MKEGYDVSRMLMFEPPTEDMLQVKFWGVRGSYPVPGETTRIFGGNTPCVEVRLGSRLFIIDAGTGIVPLGRALLAEKPLCIDLLLSHLHHDHISALPFFAPAFFANTTINTYCGNLDGDSASEALKCMYSPPLFPVTLDELPATFRHVGFRAGETLTFDDGSAVTTLPMRHPSGATAFRFDHRGRALAYVSDIEHELPWPPKELISFVHGVDLMIFDTMFTECEYQGCKGWGHSTLESAIQLADKAEVKSFAAFHHNPKHDDVILAAREADLQKQRPGSFFAREGMHLAFQPVDAALIRAK